MPKRRWPTPPGRTWHVSAAHPRHRELEARPSALCLESSPWMVTLSPPAAPAHQRCSSGSIEHRKQAETTQLTHSEPRAQAAAPPPAQHRHGFGTKRWLSTHVHSPPADQGPGSVPRQSTAQPATHAQAHPPSKPGPGSWSHTSKPSHRSW